MPGGQEAQVPGWHYGIAQQVRQLEVFDERPWRALRETRKSVWPEQSVIELQQTLLDFRVRRAYDERRQPIASQQIDQRHDMRRAHGDDADERRSRQTGRAWLSAQDSHEGEIGKISRGHNLHCRICVE